MESLDNDYIWIEDHKELWWSIGKIMRSDSTDTKFIARSIDDESEHDVEK